MISIKNTLQFNPTGRFAQNWQDIFDPLCMRAFNVGYVFKDDVCCQRRRGY